MDQAIPRILWFDRFALDLMRGCLRADDQDIHLRPKTFEVLRHLAENAGRLVPKQELHEAVWPTVAVTDDSLVQCIRELREKLGDDEHRLIRTVSRRGYLLDAAVSAVAPPSAASFPACPVGAQDAAAGPVDLHRTVHAVRTGSVLRWSACAAGLACVAAGLVYLLGLAGREPTVPAGRAASAPEPELIRPAFRHCDVCPEMIAAPAGAFRMGSPEGEFGRDQSEGVPRRVRIDRPIAIGRFEVTVDQFSTFLAETGKTPSNQCRLIVTFDGNAVGWGPREASFRQPGYDATGAHPVGCVSWHDAQAYAAWLRRRTGRPYRLPTEAEWEYVARAGTTSPFSFGQDVTELCAYARFADLASPFAWRGGCRSNIATYGPAPVGTLRPNPWGAFDVHGNVWEWVEDCWTSDASKIPTDGTALARPDGCEVGVVRGGSWASGTRRLRSAARLPAVAASHDQNIGFRVVLSLDPGSMLKDHRKVR